MKCIDDPKRICLLKADLSLEKLKVPKSRLIIIENYYI